MFVLIVIAYLLVKKLSQMSSYARDEGIRTTKCFGAANRLREQQHYHYQPNGSENNRARNKRMSREERLRELIKRHGGRNVSDAVRFLANELHKQKLALLQNVPEQGVADSAVATDNSGDNNHYVAASTFDDHVASRAYSQSKTHDADDDDDDGNTDDVATTHSATLTTLPSGCANNNRGAKPVGDVCAVSCHVAALADGDNNNDDAASKRVSPIMSSSMQSTAQSDHVEDATQQPELQQAAVAQKHRRQAAQQQRRRRPPRRRRLVHDANEQDYDNTTTTTLLEHNDRRCTSTATTAAECVIPTTTQATIAVSKRRQRGRRGGRRRARTRPTNDVAAAAAVAAVALGQSSAADVQI